MWLGHMRLVCCSVLQCVAVCCSVVQCGAVCCVVLQCVAVLQCDSDIRDSFHDRRLVCCNVLQCVAVCCSVLQSCNVTRTYETPFMTGANRDSCHWQRSTHMSTQRHNSFIRDMKYSLFHDKIDTCVRTETRLIHERHDSFSTVCLACAVSIMTIANRDSCYWKESTHMSTQRNDSCLIHQLHIWLFGHVSKERAICVIWLFLRKEPYV